MKIKEHIITQIINIVVALPVVTAGVVYTFKPHVETFVTDLVRNENQRMRYESVGEQLTRYRNITEADKTLFVLSEIKRLEELQRILGDKLTGGGG